MGKDRALRFGVGSADGLHSIVWRVWVGGEEAYVAPRALADVAKVSLHSSGRWRSGFDAQHIERTGMHMAPEADRAILKWHRPSEVAAGWTKAVVILAPTSDLRTEVEYHEYSKVIWIDPPSEDLDIRFTVLLASTEAGEDEGLPEPFSSAHRVGELQLAGGERVLVVAEQTPFDSAERSELEAARAILGVASIEDDDDGDSSYPFSVFTALDDREEFVMLLGIASPD